MTYLHPITQPDVDVASPPPSARISNGSIELLAPDCQPSNVETARIISATQDDGGHHPTPRSETSALDAWIQLTKAYIGPGCLSLPWAVSQLGLPVGTTVICVVAFWTSYNCWNVVALKRIIMRERQQQQLQTDPHHLQPHQHQQVTYPDVGEWAYNRKFKDILLVSICVQQLAVCTVFLSFIGENIAAVMERTLSEADEKPPSHALVITLALPFALLLSCLPNLKVLTPVMVVATISLFVGFGLLGVVIGEEWESRPQDTRSMYDIEWAQVPMAVCAILYSYEGICVVLPVESAMARPEHFKTVFVSSMAFTAVVFASVACLCVIAFGDVTNGSVTAFLVENLEDEQVKWWLYMANTACSLAVLLTYPLQLFPSFELIGPWMTKVLRLDIGTHALQHAPIRTFSPIPNCENPDDRVVGNHHYHDRTELTVNRPSRTDDVIEDASDLEYTAADNQLPFMAAFTTPGDSPQLRAILVCFTYVLAIAVPNVQLLVSLAGALSGSATGLIVPPLLILANVKREEAIIRNSTITASQSEEEEVDNEVDTLTPVGSVSKTPFNLRLKKWECYVLFGGGVVVCVFGTGAALVDIASVYMGA